MIRTDPLTRRQGSTRTALCGLLAAAALVVSACAAAATSSPAPTAAPTAAATTAGSPAAAATVATAQHPSLGTYLTGADGKSLYLFVKDSKDKSTASASLIANWPPLMVSGSAAPTGGTGVTGTLATITRDDATKQVTYNGIPLYYFAKDAKAGDFQGQGVGANWWLVGPNSTAASGTITGGLGQTGAATAAPTAGGTANSVQIRNSAFPATTTVIAGTTVTWTNGDGEDHTVTADNGSFDSKNITPGATFQQTFSTAGNVAYHCNIHPDMKGTVVVTSAASITY